MTLQDDIVEDHLIKDLRRRLQVINSPEYQASTCYQLGDRVLIDTILWLALATATVAVTLMFWL